MLRREHKERPIVHHRRGRLTFLVESDRQITMSRRVAWIEGDTALECFDSAPRLRAAHEDDAEIGPGLGIGRSERHKLP